MNPSRFRQMRYEPSKKSTRSFPQEFCAQTFLLERAGGRERGFAGRPASVSQREHWKIQIELPSVEPPSETGKF